MKQSHLKRDVDGRLRDAATSACRKRGANAETVLDVIEHYMNMTYLIILWHVRISAKDYAAFVGIGKTSIAASLTYHVTLVMSFAGARWLHMQRYNFSLTTMIILSIFWIGEQKGNLSNYFCITMKSCLVTHYIPTMLDAVSPSTYLS